MIYLGAAPEPGLKSLGKFTNVVGHGGLPGGFLRSKRPGKLPCQLCRLLQVLPDRLGAGFVIADVGQIFRHGKTSLCRNILQIQYNTKTVPISVQMRNGAKNRKNSQKAAQHFVQIAPRSASGARGTHGLPIKNIPVGCF